MAPYNHPGDRSHRDVTEVHDVALLGTHTDANPSVQVDLSVLRGPAAFLNYRDTDRPMGRPGADSADPDTTMAAEVQAAAVAPTPISSPSVPTPVVPAAAAERMRIAHTDGLGVALRSAARLDAREPRCPRSSGSGPSGATCCRASSASARAIGASTILGQMAFTRRFASSARCASDREKLITPSRRISGSRGLKDFDSALVGYAVGSVFALAAVVFRYTLWITRPPTWRYFEAGWTNFLSWRNFRRYTVLIPIAWWTDIFGQTFIWKRSRQRWLMHMAIFWGVVLSCAITFPLTFGWIRFTLVPPDQYQLWFSGCRSFSSPSRRAPGCPVPRARHELRAGWRAGLAAGLLPDLQADSAWAGVLPHLGQALPLRLRQQQGFKTILERQQRHVPKSRLQLRP
jgi:hypothetical protein